MDECVKMVTFNVSCLMYRQLMFLGNGGMFVLQNPFVREIVHPCDSIQQPTSIGPYHQHPLISTLLCRLGARSVHYNYMHS